jgi:flavoprotein
MTMTKIAADGKYLAQCRQCGTWVEVCPDNPENCQAEVFFAVLQLTFQCCGLRQAATFTIEKDTVDFH